MIDINSGIDAELEKLYDRFKWNKYDIRRNREIILKTIDNGVAYDLITKNGTIYVIPVAVRTSVAYDEKIIPIKAKPYRKSQLKMINISVSPNRVHLVTETCDCYEPNGWDGVPIFKNQEHKPVDLAELEDDFVPVWIVDFLDDAKMNEMCAMVSDDYKK